MFLHISFVESRFYNMFKNPFFLLTLFFLLVASSCKKNRANNFPSVSVEQYIYLNNATNFDLQFQGGAVYADGGLKGLIIYRRYNNSARDDFAAYDRACPVHFEEDCAQLEITDDKTFAKCSCGGEEYLLYDGSPTGGAQYGLVEYSAIFDGSIIYVKN